MESEYLKRVDDLVVNSFVGMAMGIGIKVGLFKAFHDIGGKSCTSIELAKQAGLKERYVREWLGCMVAGRIVFLDEDDKYYLPVDADLLLKRRYNADLLPVVGPISAELIRCMPENGPTGFNYDTLSSVHEWLDQDRKKVINHQFMKEHVEPATKLLSRDPLSILDFGCGSGRVSVVLAKYYENASVDAIDESKEATEKAKCIAQENNTQNLKFHAMKGEHLPQEWTSKYDMVLMFDVLHDLADPVASLREIKRVMKPDGVMVAFDPAIHSAPRKNIDIPDASIFYAISMLICVPCSLSKEPFIGHGIGWGYENRKEFLKENGLQIIQLGDDNLDELNMRLVCKKAN